MSVFTPISIDEARAFLKHYEVGEIIDFQDIAAGVENSNFFVTTTDGRFVLTIFEKIPRADLDFYIGLMRHLHEAGIACAAPVRNNQGGIIGALKMKPAVLVERLSGGDIAHPTESDCHAVGVALAQMHAAAGTFKLPMSNWRGLPWWQHEAHHLGAYAQPDEQALVRSEVAYLHDFDRLKLPRGVIHADLFRDNILWTPDRVPQMIDFYFACHDHLLWDVAITVNDWCLDLQAYPQAQLDLANTRALLRGYASVRAFTPEEHTQWPRMLRAAALRSWLGRLGYHYYPRASSLTHSKDHPFSERLLRYHIANADAAHAHMRF